MDKLVRSKKSEYYLDFLNTSSPEGYEFEYFSEEIQEGDDKICLRLNIDCETYLLGELNKDGIIEEYKDKGSYIGFGFDSQSLSVYIVNKEKFFDKHIVPLKKILKESSFGSNIRAINFYRKKGSEIYLPEVLISIKSDFPLYSLEWVEISIGIKMILDEYIRVTGIYNLQYIMT